MSKCKKYSTSHIKGKPKVCDTQINKDAFSKMVEQSLVYPSSFDAGAVMRTCDLNQGQGQSAKVKRTPRVWPKDAQGALEAALSRAKEGPNCVSDCKRYFDAQQLQTYGDLLHFMTVQQGTHMYYVTFVQIASADELYPGGPVSIPSRMLANLLQVLG
jgi:hypothetical protein